jgi:hypothetical protein
MMTRYDIQKEGRLARKEDGREAGVCAWRGDKARIMQKNQITKIVSIAFVV